MTDVSEVIRSARTGAGLSQVEVAASAGTSQPALARYETGAMLPTLPTLERVLAACGRTLEIRAVRARTPAAPVASVRGLLDSRADRLRRNRGRLLAAARACGVRRVRVFGSLARGMSGPGSDVDLLVDLTPGRTLLDLAAFRRQAEEILGAPVDVATLDMFKDRIRAEVEDEAVPL
jgi:predicted nucleotidyltransferase/DNA-binding XRE family transcriptional regulator